LNLGSLLALLFGFILGLEHTLDLDHLVAVSTIASENKSLGKSLLIGGAWGFGHTLILFAVGMLVLTFKLTIPNSLTRFFELLVGMMLIGLGVWVIQRVRRSGVHIHRHSHRRYSHIHVHSHKNTKSHHHVHKSLLVGMLQGLAGSAGLMLIMVLTMKTVIQGFIFILLFGLGTIAGMAIVGTIISLPFLLTKWSVKVNKRIKMLTGLLSIGLGLLVIVQQL